MDQQLKRGFIEASVLAVLMSRESYGYQIIHDMPPALGITESTLYPVLKRLETSGSVTTRTAEHNGRLRKYYRITSSGAERLRVFANERVEVASVYDFIEGKLGPMSPGQCEPHAEDTATIPNSTTAGMPMSVSAAADQDAAEDGIAAEDAIEAKTTRAVVAPGVRI